MIISKLIFDLMTTAEDSKAMRYQTPLMASFCAVHFYPRDVLDEIWDLIESVSEGFPTYSSIYTDLFNRYIDLSDAL